MVHLSSIFNEWNGPCGVKRKCRRDQAITYVHKGSQMKAVQELLIFPFPNFFTYLFCNVVFERKKAISYFRSKKIPDKPQKKINSMTWLSLDSYQWGWDLFRSIANPLSFFCFYIKVKDFVCHLHTSEAEKDSIPCPGGQYGLTARGSLHLRFSPISHTIPARVLHCPCQRLPSPLLFLIKFL